MASVSRLLKSRALRLKHNVHKVLGSAMEGVGRVVMERMVQNAPVDPGIRATPATNPSTT